jgi:hypothetical protein
VRCGRVRGVNPLNSDVVIGPSYTTQRAGSSSISANVWFYSAIYAQGLNLDDIPFPSFNCRFVGNTSGAELNLIPLGAGVEIESITYIYDDADFGREDKIYTISFGTEIITYTLIKYIGAEWVNNVGVSNTAAIELAGGVASDIYDYFIFYVARDPNVSLTQPIMNLHSVVEHSPGLFTREYNYSMDGLPDNTPTDTYTGSRNGFPSSHIRVRLSVDYAYDDFMIPDELTTTYEDVYSYSGLTASAFDSGNAQAKIVRESGGLVKEVRFRFIDTNPGDYPDFDGIGIDCIYHGAINLIVPWAVNNFNDTLLLPFLKTETSTRSE